MQLPYLAIFVATVLQFFFGFIWYMPIFGKLWGKIHGFDQVSKEEQAKMMKGMGPLLATQFLMTLLTSFVLGLFSVSLPAEWNVFGEAGFFWLGFVMPAQVAAVIFGGDAKKWHMTKIAIATGASFFCYQIAAATFYFMK